MVRVAHVKTAVGLLAMGGAVSLCLLAQPAQAEASWSFETDCATCHAEQVEALSTGDHAALSCETCHTDEAALATVHDEAKPDAKMPTKLKKTEVGDAVCLACHGDDGAAWAAAGADGEVGVNGSKQADATVGSSAEKTSLAVKVSASNDGGSTSDADHANMTRLIEATADSTVLTDSNGTVVNPHDLPAVKDHDGIECATCHKIHDPEPDAPKVASKKCLTCHHDGVYECYTCHA